MPGWYAGLRDRVGRGRRPAAGAVGLPAPIEPERPSGELWRLAGNADRIVVVDVETTGLTRSDRVVEIAIITIDPTGRIVEEFDTLVDPTRDVGPTRIHGITASMLIGAPLFGDIAAEVAARLDGAVVVAHNLPFDTGVVGRELEAAGIEIDWGRGLDTLRATGRKLADSCAEFGIPLDSAHRALVDARATAELLLAVTEEFDRAGEAAVVRYRPGVGQPRLHTREDAATEMVSRSRDVARHRAVSTPAEIAEYLAAVRHAVAGLRLPPPQRGELAALAARLRLDRHEIAGAHQQFVSELVSTTIVDAAITADGLALLYRTAALLDVDSTHVTRSTDPYSTVAESITLVRGLEVCFTGEAVTDTGLPVERPEIADLAERCGLVVRVAVTKRSCGLLVAADTLTQSVKGANARRFGTPIAVYPEFWRAMTAGGPLCVRRFQPIGPALVCGGCGISWIARQRAARPVCAACKAGSTYAIGDLDDPASGTVASLAAES